MITGPYVATLAPRNRADSPSGGCRDGTLDAATFRRAIALPPAIPETCRPARALSLEALEDAWRPLDASTSAGP